MQSFISIQGIYLQFYSLLSLSNTLRQSECAEFQTFFFLKNMVVALTKGETRKTKDIFTTTATDLIDFCSFYFFENDNFLMKVQ